MIFASFIGFFIIYEAAMYSVLAIFFENPELQLTQFFICKTTLTSTSF